PLQIVDEQHYAEIATNLVRGNGFAFHGRLTSARPPLYPMMVAAIWKATGNENPQAVRTVQIALSLANTFVVFLIRSLLFNERVGVCAAAAFCFYPMLLFSGVVLLTEVLFTLLLSLALLASLMLLRRPGIVLAATTGIAFGLATLTRS